MVEGEVDKSKSTRKNDEFGEPMTVAKLLFDESGIEDKLIFKSECEFYQAPFCNDKFKDLCQESEIEGLF